MAREQFGEGFDALMGTTPAENESRGSVSTMSLIQQLQSANRGGEERASSVRSRGSKTSKNTGRQPGRPATEGRKARFAAPLDDFSESESGEEQVPHYLVLSGLCPEGVYV